MNKLVLLLALACVSCAPQAAADKNVAAWEQQAQNVTIIRDDWGIAHVYGKTDADAVFGAIYAQAEDDFNRVETNFLNSMGRLAEAEGESEIYRDLRMKIFIDPADMKAQYEKAPAWLKPLMNAWADGLNDYLYTHPKVTPRVITHFEPWMALTFSEGSIGGDIETVNLNQLEAFYGKTAPKTASAFAPPALRRDRSAEELNRFVEPTGSNGAAIAPSNTTAHHALLLINPHTSFFFRSELQMVSDEGLNAYGASTWGQFFIYQGFNEKTGWMHTSSGVDNIDEYLETVTKKGDGYTYHYGTDERPVTASKITVPYKTASGMAQKDFTIYRTHHGPVVREADGKWVSDPADAGAGEGADAVVHAHEGEELQGVQADDGAAHELVEQHDLRRRGRRHRVLPRQLHSEARHEVRLDETGGRQRSRDRVERRALDRRDATSAQSRERLALQLQQLAVVGGRAEQPEEGGLSRVRGPRQRGEPARLPRAPRAREQEGLHAGRPHRGGLRQLSAGVRHHDPAAAEGLRSNAAANPLKAKLAEQIALLRGWDFRWSATSVPTSLAVFWSEEAGRRVGDEARKAGTSADNYVARHATPEQMLQALSAASDKLASDFGSWKTPWGDINRYQRLTGDIVQPFNDAGPSIPVGFTSARWGSLASFGARTYKGTKKMYGTTGNSFVAVVEFGDRVQAKAVTAGGESGDPRRLTSTIRPSGTAQAI